MQRQQRRTRFASVVSLSSAAFTAIVLATPLAAQGVIVSSSGGNGVVTSHSPMLPIADDAVRAILSAHFPAILQPGAEDNLVVLVVDANGQYVSGKASKADPNTGQSVVRLNVNGDTAAVGAVVVRSTSGDQTVAAAGALQSAAFGSFFMMSHDSSGSQTGVMGTDYKISDVSTMGLKRYAAGELAAGQLIVAVVKLK